MVIALLRFVTLILLVAAVIYLAYRYRMKKLEQEHEAAMAHQKARYDDLVDALEDDEIDRELEREAERH